VNLGRTGGTPVNTLKETDRRGGEADEEKEAKKEAPTMAVADADFEATDLLAVQATIGVNPSVGA